MFFCYSTLLLSSELEQNRTQLFPSSSLVTTNPFLHSLFPSMHAQHVSTPPSLHSLHTHTKVKLKILSFSFFSVKSSSSLAYLTSPTVIIFFLSLIYFTIPLCFSFFLLFMLLFFLAEGSLWEKNKERSSK